MSSCHSMIVGLLYSFVLVILHVSSFYTIFYIIKSIVGYNSYNRREIRQIIQCETPDFFFSFSFSNVVHRKSLST